MRTNWMDIKAKEPFEHRAMKALKRRLKFGPKMTKQQCADYVRRLLRRDEKCRKNS